MFSEKSKIIITLVFYVVFLASLFYLLFYVSGIDEDWFLNEKVTMFIFICGASVSITSILNLIRNIKK